MNGMCDSARKADVTRAKLTHSWRGKCLEQWLLEQEAGQAAVLRPVERTPFDLAAEGETPLFEAASHLDVMRLLKGQKLGRADHHALVCIPEIRLHADPMSFARSCPITFGKSLLSLSDPSRGRPLRQSPPVSR
jgi:hypothetical protein